LASIPKKKWVNKDQPKENEFIGYTGSTVYAGYFDEDYITDLNGKTAVETYDKMRRGDGQVKMVLNAIKNPIKSASFKHVPASDSARDKEIAEFLDWNWFENDFFDFSEKLSEILTYLDFGFCVMEKELSRAYHKYYKDVHALTDIGFRKQSTIESWDIQGRRGLQGIRQIAYGDTVDDQTAGDVYIPRESLLIFTNEKEGDNYEGISLLRQAYGHWFRKNLYLKLNGIGIEKGSIGTPVGKYPRGAKEDEKQKFIQTLSNFTGHQSAHIVIPQGYDLEVFKTPYDSDKTMSSIFYEDTQMSKMILFQFLELGQNGSSGSYALGADQSDLALASIQFIGDYICRKMDKVNQDLVRWNFGEVDENPRCKCSGINQKKGKELAELIKTYVDSRVIRPDDTLEINVRETHNLPKMETTREEDAKKRETDTITRQGQDRGGDDDPGDDDQNLDSDQKKPGSEDPPESTNSNDQVPKPPKFSEPSQSEYFRALTEYEKPINLAEIKEGFEDEKRKLLRTMKTELSQIVTNTLRIVERLLKKNEDNRSSVATEFKVNKRQYEKKLQAQLTNIVVEGANQAQKDLSAKLPRELDEKLQTTRSFKKQTQFLPKHIQNALFYEIARQAETHAQRIESVVGFGIISGVEAQKTDKEIIFQIEKDLEQYVDSPQVQSAAGTLAAKGINRGRFGFFFDQKNLQKIQAFQYSAVLDGATTPICLSLDKKIVKPNDPDLLSLRPPNHYNCRSILVPITIYEEKPEITGIQVDPTNESLVKQFEKRGKEPPDMQKILKTRNI